MFEIGGGAEALELDPEALVLPVADDGMREQMPVALELGELVRRGAQGDLDVQRYKGLGEMDADQLWESTMDPSIRCLYRVRMEDAISADQIFTILMSEGVEERRRYIERHALEVTNLDV